MTDIEITQADKLAARDVGHLTEERGRIVAEAFARHRIEARAAALEEAADVAEDFAAAMNAMRTHPDPLPIDTNEGWRRVMDGALDVATAIRALKGEQA